MFAYNNGRSWQQKDRIQGLLFDGAIFLANIYLLGSIFDTPLAEFSDRRIGLLLGVGVLTQFVGAILKKGPLQQRIIDLQIDQSQEREGTMGCLSFIHFIFFLIVVAMSLALAGLFSLNDSTGAVEFIWVSTAFVIAVVVSGAVWLAIRNPETQEVNDNWWAHQELLANLILWISAAILTRFFWAALLLESEPPSYMGFNSRAFVYIAATSALFMVFYIPARILFLVEDYKYPMTWLRLWLVAMLPLLTIVFFGRP